MGGLKLIDFWNITGDIAFCIEGIIAARKSGSNRSMQFLSGFTTTFFGGALLRDIMMLNIIPSIFRSPIEILLVCLFAAMLIFILTYGIKNSKSIPVTISGIMKKVIVMFDSLGILACVVIGFENARAMNASFIISIVCSFYTACGGGIIAALIRGMAISGLQKKWAYFKDTLIINIPYYTFGFSISITYGLISLAGAEKNLTYLLLTPLVIVLGYLTDINISDHSQGKKRGKA